MKFWPVQHTRRDIYFLPTSIDALAVTPDGKTLAARQRNSSDIVLWDLQTNRSWTISVGPDGIASAMAISNRHLAVGTHGRVQLFRLGETLLQGESIRLETKTDITTIALSDDGSRLAAGDREGGVAVWRITVTKPQFECSQHSRAVTAVKFTPDGTALASGSLDGSVILRDVETGNCINKIEASSDDVTCVAFSTDGTILASAGADDTTRLWRNWRAPKSVADVTLTGHSDVIYAISFLPDGRSLISASGDKTLRIWDIRDGQQRFTLTGHTSAVECADFSRTARLLASGSRDGTIRLWRAAAEDVGVPGW